MLFDYRKTFLFCLLGCCVLSMTWPRTSSADIAKTKYYRAEACYKKLRHSPKKQKYRSYWLGCINKFQSVYRYNPSGPWAAAGLYMSGKLYKELYGRSFKASDKKAAIDSYKQVVKDYPKSAYKHKAENALRNLFPKGIPKIASKRKISKQSHVMSREDDIAKEIKKFYAQTTVKRNIKGSQGKTCTVVGLRFWSNPNYTRVVIDADREISYSRRLLKKDTAIKKPHRLYIDLRNSKLGKDTVEVEVDLLKTEDFYFFLKARNLYRLRSSILSPKGISTGVSESLFRLIQKKHSRIPGLEFLTITSIPFIPVPFTTYVINLKLQNGDVEITVDRLYL